MTIFCRFVALAVDFSAHFRWAFRWSFKRTIIAPSCFPSISKKACWYACFFNPFRSCFCKTIYSVMFDFSCVPVLFFRCSPSQISRFVTPFIVNSINGVFDRWGVANFSIKFFKAGKITFNPSPSIKAKVRILGVIAAAKDRAKNTVFPASPFSVRGKSFFCKVAGKASTAFCELALDMAGVCLNYIATVAKTVPRCSRSSNPCITYDLEPSAPLSLKVYEAFNFTLFGKDKLFKSTIQYSHDLNTPMFDSG